AVNDIGVAGSLHIAHNTKKIARAERGYEKPFGSAFWHNSARATWFIAAVPARSDDRLTLSFKPRKSNLTERGDDMSITIEFGADQTTVALKSAASNAGSSTESQILTTLGGKPLALDALKAALPHIKPNTLIQAIHRSERLQLKRDVVSPVVDK